MQQGVCSKTTFPVGGKHVCEFRSIQHELPTPHCCRDTHLPSLPPPRPPPHSSLWDASGSSRSSSWEVSAASLPASTCPCSPLDRRWIERLKCITWGTAPPRAWTSNRWVTGPFSYPPHWPSTACISTLPVTFPKGGGCTLTNSVSVHMRRRSTSRFCRMLLMLSISCRTASAVLQTGREAHKQAVYHPL